MKTIIPNIWMLLLRLAVLGLFIYMYQWPLEKITTGQYNISDWLFWLGLTLYTMFPAYLFWTLFGVLLVRISNDKSKIRFHYLHRTIEVAGSEMACYYKTVYHTKVSSFQGMFIKLKSNEVVEVTEYNLRSVKEIRAFLRYNNTPFKGDKNSWYPLKRRI